MPPPTPTPKRPAQVMVMFAIFLTVLLLLIGSAYDYGSILVDDAQLHNAVDSAALAGADALSRSAAQPAGTPAAVSRATAAAYLALNGVATQTPGTNVQITYPTSTPAPGATPSTAIENLSMSITRNHPTAFWTIVGLNRVTMQAAGSAHASRNMLDIMLSLDATGSEIISGSFTSIQQAVVNFINVVNPTRGDPRGPRIGIARFAGIRCTWVNDAGDNYLHIYSDNSPRSEYRAPCTDDKTVLVNLNDDKQVLLTVANNSGTAACPSTAAFPVGDPVAPYGCPLQHTPYAAVESVRGTLATDICLDGGVNCLGGTRQRLSTWPGFLGAPYFTGTKLPNAISAVSQVDPPPPDPSAAYYAWNTVNGGRNDPSTNNNAHKVLVMFTDGQNEGWPTAQETPDPAFPEDASDTGYGAQLRTLAQHLKLGPDQQPGTDDDVEIYVVGYFCTPYSSADSSFCKSRLAATSTPHPCPGPTYPTGATSSAVDDLLVTISSSTSGSCDHYYPLSKTETTSLPQLFTQLAGTISRGQLTQ